MLLNEITNTDLLTEAEFATIEEAFSNELKALIQSAVSGPIKKKIADVKNEVFKSFTPKLKAWAMSELKHAKREGPEAQERVERILNNAAQVAQQIIDNALVKEFGAEDCTDDVPQAV